MIQRIQSLYLLLTILMSALFLSGNYLMFINSSGAEAYVGITGIDGFSPGGFNDLVWYLITLPVAAASILALIAIFLFRNRPLQARITVITGVLVLLALTIMVFFITSAMGEKASPLFCLRSFLPLVSLILIFLAYRSIKKDENLVKSLERLR